MKSEKHAWIASLERSAQLKTSDTAYTPFAFARTVANARLEEALARTAQLEAHATELSTALSDRKAAIEKNHAPKAVLPVLQINDPAFLTNL